MTNHVDSSTPVEVEISLLRIQTYLFSVPRLSDMVGANSLLGEVIRKRLPSLAADIGGLDCSKYNPPSKSPDDPLTTALLNRNSLSEWDHDDPLHGYSQGILSRDGGHFRVIFDSIPKANNFIQQAQQLLQTEVSGLQFEIRQNAANVALSHSDIANLPQFQICQESGQDPATLYDKTRDRSYSLASQQKKMAYENIKKQPSDVIAQLSSVLPTFERLAKDLEDLSGKSGYIAVIHADGNSIGNRLTRWLKKHQSLDPLQMEAHAESFFHSLRVASRSALCSAITQEFSQIGSAVQPYQILMSGGDDLLFICQPHYAMRFVVAYSQALEKLPLADGAPMSIGAGIVIAKHTIPFNRLHHQAETLASSAKQLFLRCPDIQCAQDDCKHHPERSVVDWAISSNSWSDIPEVHRQRHDLIHYTDSNGQLTQLALIARPYFILENSSTAKNWYNSLQEIIAVTDKLSAQETDSTSRSQLINFLSELEKGKESASFAYDQLPMSLREALTTLLNITAGKDIWLSAGDNRYITHLKDLIELWEIPLLGSTTQASVGP